MENEPWYADVVMPALLRNARSAYGRAMRAALEAAGYDDIPGNGLYIIGGLALSEGQGGLGDLIRQLTLDNVSCAGFAGSPSRDLADPGFSA